MRSADVARYTIQHRTAFSYSRPVHLQSHRLMLLPRSSDALHIVRSSLIFVPKARVEWNQDVFGNLIATAEFAGATSSLVIESRVAVEQSVPQWPVFRIDPRAHDYPFLYSDADLTDLGALLRPEHDDPGGRLAGWVRSLIHAVPTDTLSLLQDLNAGIHSLVRYRVREEEGTQTPSETIERGSGSCRDIAALFIDAARLLGFGARAASGYLYDPEVPLSAAGSTHAWAEVYLPGAGWIAFDPTHRRMGSAGLVPVAVARCNDQTLPVIGGYAGAPEDFAGMDVSVIMSKESPSATQA